MASTPHGSWEGSQHFGLRDLLEQTTRRPEKVQLAVEEINHALDDLGITSFQVEGITCESPAGAEVNRWVVTLASKADRTRTYSFEWSGKSQ